MIERANSLSDAILKAAEYSDDITTMFVYEREHANGDWSYLVTSEPIPDGYLRYRIQGEASKPTT